MIKLNNKNITYVALADSNNSLKAPKEIWYADSSNSVKLVYRRKDALIEGEDYEKYHWLNGRNGAYINTEHLVKTYEDAFEVYAKYDGTTRNPDGGEQNPFGMQGENVIIASYIDGASNINAVIKQSDSTSNHNINIYKEVFKLTLYASNSSEYVKILDGVSYTNPIGGTVANDTNLKMHVFSRNGKANSYFHGDISYFRITDSTFVTDKLHLIPCKLLKPVPKWLDANGIRRQVGECGMIDLVSGKFYGNVNSVGTFTVENYYERKEWLCGRNGAYIDTMHPLTTIDDAMKVHAHYDGVVRNPTGNEQAICGVVEDMTDANKLWAYIYIGTDNNLNAYQRGVYRYSIYGTQTDSVNSLEFIASISNDGNNFTFTKNSNSITENSPITRETYGNVYLFNRNTMAQPELVSQRYFQGDIASFQIGNSTFTELSVDMIPCTLTMDLPASMDANNIARTKGTSGMWDLVSDKFYGNVANSGTFKAVNLAEGVDYEVHQWLVADIPIGVAMMSLPINSSTFNCTIEHTGVRANLQHLYSDGYIYFTESSNMDMIAVWDVSESNTLFRASVGSLMTIESNEEYFKINNISITKYGFPILRMVIQSSYNSNNASTTKTSSINVDGIERYIPVKLLHSIPSKYDANGIARQAGECGMYDTVNDVFYGNVASSGSFIVDDDE